MVRVTRGPVPRDLVFGFHIGGGGTKGGRGRDGGGGGDGVGAGGVEYSTPIPLSPKLS